MQFETAQTRPRSYGPGSGLGLSLLGMWTITEGFPAAREWARRGAAPLRGKSVALVLEELQLLGRCKCLVAVIEKDYLFVGAVAFLGLDAGEQAYPVVMRVGVGGNEDLHQALFHGQG